MAETQTPPKKENNENIVPQSGRRVRRVERERIPFSNPEVEHNFTLNTQEAIRLYTRHFNTVSQGLFNIMINTTRLDRLGQNGASTSAKKVIDSAFDIPTKEINVIVESLSEMLAKAGDVAEVKYTNPRDFSTATRTPEATRLINLFKRYDLTVSLLDKAYLNGFAPPDEVEDTKLRLSNIIQVLAKTIKTHAQGAVEQLDKLAGAENADSEAIVEDGQSQLEQHAEETK